MTEKYAWVDRLASALYYAYALSPQNVEEMDAMGLLIDRYAWVDTALENKVSTEHKAKFHTHAYVYPLDENKAERYCEQMEQEPEDYEDQDEALLMAKHLRTHNTKRKRTEEDDANMNPEDVGGMAKWQRYNDNNIVSDDEDQDSAMDLESLCEAIQDVAIIPYEDEEDTGMSTLRAVRYDPVYEENLYYNNEDAMDLEELFEAHHNVVIIPDEEDEENGISTSEALRYAMEYDDMYDYV